MTESNEAPHEIQLDPRFQRIHFRRRVAAPGGRWPDFCHLSSVIDSVIYPSHNFPLFPGFF